MEKQGEQVVIPLDGSCHIQLPEFVGPLDLLLHLIEKHELDILNIPIAFVTQKYLEYLKWMHTFSIDLASEYLVMAATLAYIKSKMLLPTVPQSEEETEEEDPREELIRRLLEYQKYKWAASNLSIQNTLGQAFFARGQQETPTDEPGTFSQIGLFSLMDAFQKILERKQIKFEHEIIYEHLSIADRIGQISDKLRQTQNLKFEDLFESANLTRFDIVISFLAILEMCKLNLLNIFQSENDSTIYLHFQEIQE